MRNLQNSHFFYRKNEKNRIRQIRSLDAVLSKGSHSKIPLFSRENQLKIQQDQIGSGYAGGCCSTGAACWLAFTRRALYVAGISVSFLAFLTLSHLSRLHTDSLRRVWGFACYRRAPARRGTASRDSISGDPGLFPPSRLSPPPCYPRSAPQGRKFWRISPAHAFPPLLSAERGGPGGEGGEGPGYPLIRSQFSKIIGCKPIEKTSRDQ